MRKFLVFSLVLGGVVLGAGCGHKSDRDPLDPSLTTQAEAPEGDAEARLRAEVRKRIEIAARTQAEDKQRVRFRSPYWYKEYAEFPNGSDGFEVASSSTESRTAPMLATVKLERLRYTTRYHRERSEAVSDESFIRDTGTDTLSFELRNGRWIFNGSTFIADKSEEFAGGAWVPVEEAAPRTVAAEEQPGWFGRAWSTLTGR